MTSSSSSRADAGQSGRVRAYFAALPADARRELRKLRAVIRSVAPDASEGFSYGIPAVRVEGRLYVWYAAWRNHTSLYPVTAATRRAHASELKGYKTSKGTIQFPLTQPLPVTLVRRILTARLRELKSRGR